MVCTRKVDTRQREGHNIICHFFFFSKQAYKNDHGPFAIIYISLFGQNLGLVVQSIISLTSLLVMTMLTVLESTVSLSQANAKAIHIFSAKI